MRWWGRQRSVTAGRDIGVAVTGDHNRILLASPVRSAYREQVGRIAPPELVGRRGELADPAAFCTADSGPAYERLTSSILDEDWGVTTGRDAHSITSLLPTRPGGECGSSSQAERRSRRMPRRCGPRRNVSSSG